MQIRYLIACLAAVLLCQTASADIVQPESRPPEQHLSFVTAVRNLVESTGIYGFLRTEREQASEPGSPG
ncbi:MAG: hypothetical protein ABR497_12360, partial [Kiritimatiellia bacterium]